MLHDECTDGAMVQRHKQLVRARVSRFDTVTAHADALLLACDPFSGARCFARKVPEVLELRTVPNTAPGVVAFGDRHFLHLIPRLWAKHAMHELAFASPEPCSRAKLRQQLTIWIKLTFGNDCHALVFLLH